MDERNINFPKFPDDKPIHEPGQLLPYKAYNMTPHPIDSPPLTRFAWLSIGAAIFTIVFKSLAYFLTGSVGLLSDALESFVNLVGALMALAMLTIAARPADEDHAYGHSKAEYFSSGVEGTLILVAALSIAATAIPRLIAPKPLEQVGLGSGVSVVPLQAVRARAATRAAASIRMIAA